MYRLMCGGRMIGRMRDEMNLALARFRENGKPVLVFGRKENKLLKSEEEIVNYFLYGK